MGRKDERVFIVRYVITEVRTARFGAGDEAEAREFLENYHEQIDAQVKEHESVIVLQIMEDN